MGQRSNVLVGGLVVCALVVGCAHVQEGPAGPPTIEPIAPEELPLEASFVPIGSIGTAYRLGGEKAGEVRFPTTKGSVEGLLPATVRLFRFEEGLGRWREIADSRYDEGSGDLVGAELEPGLYTAFGWSANPVENALQRILLDLSLGYGGPRLAPGLGSGSGQPERLSIDAFRRLVLRNWLEVSFTYEFKSCRTKNEPWCPPACRRAAGRVILGSCRVNGVLCPDSEEEDEDCCDCVTASVTERVVIPGSVITEPPVPCATELGGPLCPICPNGLSCPAGPFTELPQIDPGQTSPDYSILEEIGLGVVVDDLVLRDHFHQVVEEVTGNEYPVPPPWP